MIEKQNLIKLAQHTGEVLKLAIVCSDFLSSCLMVNALEHAIECKAVPVQPYDLKRVLGAAKFDVVIISSDLNSKNGSGFDLVTGISRAHRDTQIVMLLSHASRETVIAAFQSGARAVLGRGESMSELLNCVDHVRKGLIWAGKEESSILIEALNCIPIASSLRDEESSALTKRELQVVQCASRGMTNKSIASELGLSEHTVKNYLFKAFEKLGVSSRVELLFHLTSRGQSSKQLVADAAEGDRRESA
jgi:two-component system, NarL family, nitrate/nitrite response regulator NarL